MIPILFASTATSFTSFGVGLLTEAISPHVVEEINGEYTLELQYPLSGQHFDQIKRRSVILAKPNPQDAPQPFRVMRISRPINGIVSIYAEHLSYDLSGVPVLPFTASTDNEAMYHLQHDTAVANPFTLVSELDTAGDLIVAKPASVRGVFGSGENSMLGVFGGEFHFDFYRVELLARRGRDTDITIRYGVDLVDVNQEENCQNLYTGVLPFWTKQDAIVIGTVQSAGAFDYSRVLPLDVSKQFDAEPTVADVNAAGQDYIAENNIGVPEVSISLRFAQLPELEALRGTVALGDTVGVEFVRLGVDTSARIIKTDFDVVSEKYISVDVGAPRPNIADTIAGMTQQIAEVIETPAFMAAVLQLTADILGAEGGAVRLLDTNDDGYPDTLYIADDPDPEQATYVWRFNYMGWGFSRTGFDGPFTMGASLSAGIVADFITAGTMLADRISGGTLQIGGLNNSSGRISLLNASGVEVGWIDNAGYHSWRRGDTASQGQDYESVLNSSELIFKIGTTQTLIVEPLFGSGIENRDTFYTGFEVKNPLVFTGGNLGFYYGGRAGSGTLGAPFFFNENVRVGPNFSVGGTKSRFTRTPDYGERLLYSYETPSPMFGDVGEGVTGEDGLAYVWLDPVFAETITTDQYQVVLQPYGPGELFVRERRPGCFVVQGNALTPFGWEIKAKQLDFDQLRLDRPAQEIPAEDAYGEDAADYYRTLMEGRYAK